MFGLNRFYHFNFQNCVEWKFIGGTAVVTKTVSGLYPLTWSDGIAGSLVHFKAHGGHSKHKAPKLWGEWVACEYIGFDGSSYLDLAPLTTESDIEITFRRQDGYTQTHFLFGTNPNSNTSPVVGAWYGSQGFSTQNGSLRNSASLDTNWHTVKFTATKTYLDGVEYGDAGTRLTFQNLIIGSARDERSGAVDSRAFHGDISRVKVGNKIFVPVKDVVTNAFGLFDVSGEKFYSNSGTGSITGGELIQPIAYVTNASTSMVVETPLKAFDYTTFKIKTRLKHDNSQTTSYFGTNNGYWFGKGSNGKWTVGGGIVTADVTGEWQDIEDISTKSGTQITQKITVDGVSATRTQTPTASTGNYRLFGISDYAQGISMIGSSKEWEIYGDDVLIAHYIPVRIGTTVELLDLVNWQFAQRTGRFTAGQDIPYSQLAPDIIEVNTGNLEYGLYSSNMFDKTAVKAGYYLNSSGAEVSNSAWNISDYMPVVGGETYYQTINTPGQSPRTCWYDENKTFISASEQHNGTQTAPVNAAYCRMCVWRDDTDTSMFTHGADAPTEYEPYHFGIHTDGQHKLIVRGVNLLNDANVVTAAEDMPDNLNCVYKGYFGTSDATIHNYTDSNKYRVARAQLKAGTYTWWTDTPNCHTLRKTIGNTESSYGNDVNYYTFTLTEDAEFQMCWRNASSTEFSGEHSMIVEGSVTPTVYQPYIAPIIRNIPTLYSEDSFCDTQLDSNNVSEAWAVKVLTGASAENWTKHATLDGLFLHSLAAEGALVQPTQNNYGECTCAKAVQKTAGSIAMGECCFQALNAEGPARFCLRLPFDSVDELKAYLAEKNVIIMFPLATPAISSAAVESVTVPEGTITVTEECVLATKGEITYIGRG